MSCCGSWAGYWTGNWGFWIVLAALGVGALYAWKRGGGGFDEPIATCGGCGGGVREEWSVCPKCGTKLK